MHSRSQKDSLRRAKTRLELRTCAWGNGGWGMAGKAGQDVWLPLRGAALPLGHSAEFVVGAGSRERSTYSQVLVGTCLLPCFKDQPAVVLEREAADCLRMSNQQRSCISRPALCSFVEGHLASVLFFVSCPGHDPVAKRQGRETATFSVLSSSIQSHSSKSCTKAATPTSRGPSLSVHWSHCSNFRKCYGYGCCIHLRRGASTRCSHMILQDKGQSSVTKSLQFKICKKEYLHRALLITTITMVNVPAKRWWLQCSRCMRKFVKKKMADWLRLERGRSSVCCGVCCRYAAPTLSAEDKGN